MRRTGKTVLYCLAFCLVAEGVWAVSNPEALRRKVAGNEYQARRQYPSARDQYLEALRLEPGYADVHYNLAFLYFYRLKDFGRALYHFNQYRRLEPNASDMSQVVNHISQSIQQLEEAERDDYKNAVQTATSAAFAEFLKKHSVGYYADRAREEFRRLQEIEDAKARKEAAVQSAFGRALAERTPEAMDQFLAAFPDAPQAVEARELRTQWLERRNVEEIAYQAAREEDTVKALETFIDRYPESPFAQRARIRAAHLTGAEEAYSLARDANSVAALKKFLELYGDTPYAAGARELLGDLTKGEVEKATTQEIRDLLTPRATPEASPPVTQPPPDARAPAPEPTPAKADAKAAQPPVASPQPPVASPQPPVASPQPPVASPQPPVETAPPALPAAQPEVRQAQPPAAPAPPKIRIVDVAPSGEEAPAKEAAPAQVAPASPKGIEALELKVERMSAEEERKREELRIRANELDEQEKAAAEAKRKAAEQEAAGSSTDPRSRKAALEKYRKQAIKQPGDVGNAAAPSEADATGK